MIRSLIAAILALWPIMPASADPPAVKSVEGRSQAADILGFATMRWGTPILELPNPVQMIPPKALPIGLAEGKLAELGIYESRAKFIWLLVSNGDGRLASAVTFLNDAGFDDVYRTVTFNLGRGTVGSLTLTASSEARCIFWRASGLAITMHFTNAVGTVLIVTPGEVADCGPEAPKTAEKSSIDQGV